MMSTEIEKRVVQYYHYSREFNFDELEQRWQLNQLNLTCKN